MLDFIASWTSGISIPLVFCSGFLGLITGISALFFAGFDGSVEFTFFGLGFVKKPFLNPPNVLWLSVGLEPLQKQRQTTYISQILFRVTLWTEEHKGYVCTYKWSIWADSFQCLTLPYRVWWGVGEAQEYERKETGRKGEQEWFYSLFSYITCN